MRSRFTASEAYHSVTFRYSVVLLALMGLSSYHAEVDLTKEDGTAEDEPEISVFAGDSDDEGKADDLDMDVDLRAANA